MGLFSNSAPQQPPSDGAPAAPPQARSRSRDEVRANAHRLSPAEQVQSIKDRVNARRANDPAQTAPSNAREPAPESREEARAASGPDDGADSDESTFENLEDLMEALGVDSEAFLGLKSKIKVNGEEGEVTLKEALGNHQRTAALTQKEQQLAQARDRFLAEQTEVLTGLKQQIEGAKSYHRAAFDVLERELNSPAIQQLKMTDPVSFLAWQDQFARQKQLIEQSYQNIVANENALAQQHRERISQESVSYLRSRIPDFDSRERFEKMAKVFQDRGVPANEAKAILDPRILHLVSDFADLQAKVAAYEKAEADAKKTAKTPPVSMRGNSPKPKEASTRKQLSEAKQAQAGLRGRGAIAQAAAAIKLAGRLPQR